MTEPDRWYGTPAHTLRQGDLHVVVLPERGGKIASLRHADREWLAAPAGPLRPVQYGDRFVDADMSGWDEMLPTIDACELPDGTSLPDHGEVWAVSWRVVESGPGRLVAHVSGRALAYACTRALTLSGPAEVRLDYEIEATSDQPVPVLWAAHPQFTVRPDTRIHLPDEVDAVLQVDPPTPGEQPWRNRPALDGVAPGAGRKHYLPPRTRIGEASLVDGDGRWLRLSWDPETVPYLGIWYDHLLHSREPVVALEPTTGFYDSLDRAARDGTVPMVSPGRPYRFTVTIELGRVR